MRAMTSNIATRPPAAGKGKVRRHGRPGALARSGNANHAAATITNTIVTGRAKIVTAKSATMVSRKVDTRLGRARIALSRAAATFGALARSLSGR